MSRIRLTQRRVDALRLRRKPRNLRDTELKGYGVRVMPSGAKRYFIHSQHRGQRVWKTVGDAAEIRGRWPGISAPPADRGGRGNRLSTKRYDHNRDKPPPSLTRPPYSSGRTARRNRFGRIRACPVFGRPRMRRGVRSGGLSDRPPPGRARRINGAPPISPNATETETQTRNGIVRYVTTRALDRSPNPFSTNDHSRRGNDPDSPPSDHFLDQEKVTARRDTTPVVLTRCQRIVGARRRYILRSTCLRHFAAHMPHCRGVRSGNSLAVADDETDIRQLFAVHRHQVHRTGRAYR